jgi:hypothetical protein
MLEVSDEDWEATPAPVRRGVQRLWEDWLRLREQVGKSSQNSSKPPSSDLPSAPKRPVKSPSGRHAGGQPGHADTNRPLVPEDQLAEPPMACRPVSCQHCGYALSDGDCESHPQRHQVIDIPPVVAKVTEYQLFTATCRHCGQTTKAKLPKGTPQGGYGPVVTGTVALFSGAYHLSKRDIAEMLESSFHLPISEASVQRLEQTMSAVLESPWQEACAAVQAAPNVNLDETGFNQQRESDLPTPLTAEPAKELKLKRSWLWVAVCKEAIVFIIRRTRGRQVVQELLGPVFAGLITSDRWSAYNFIDIWRRQLCWAHLLRDFAAITERGGVAKRLGTALLAQTGQMFELWFRVRDGTLAFADFQQAMVPIMARVGTLLQQGADTADSRTATTCKRLVKQKVALWTFVRVAGIEPTNNCAEQAIRAAVIWRKMCFGTQTCAGSRYVERILTVVATCRLQHRSELDYLIDVANAAYSGLPTPSLLSIPKASE